MTLPSSPNKNRESVEADTFIKINSLAQYFEQNKLGLNADKIHFIWIQTNQQMSSRFSRGPDLFIAEKELEIENVVDFLGVRLNDTLD